ncbi:allantoate amidohydrolase [Thermobifida halotolerans]|uniref:Allantoate amidohydrolase n=1 Tax=Thermobifida halotolerans TaxID=483545 RepID=A0A399G6R8_9ACTN|nr:allantoate amidohydrolase [Thermobifida halotolerans]UOE17710.1 allantoate amidohydrolase [Thermobifida halotolerans]
MSDTFDRLWAGLAPLGRDRTTGGYQRYSWTPVDAEIRTWFTAEAHARNMTVETDRNGNLWAWLGEPGPDAVVTGSHLDSVPNGGAFDGPLGVVSALAAVDELNRRGLRPTRPLAVVVFVEEEGARFGVPRLGSRLLTGAITAERARGLTDEGGVTWARAMADAGLDPDHLGADPERLARIGVFVELHIEQGRSLARLGAPVGVAGTVWPHGRWRMDFSGQADHAGTTRIADRNDPMLPFAETVTAVRRAAVEHGAVATVGRVWLTPNNSNSIPSRVRAWLDARAPGEAALRSLVDSVDLAARLAAAEHGVTLASFQESFFPKVAFPEELCDRLAAVVGGDSPAPVMSTGAGHDAAILASAVPATMLFVRNPTGISHAPEERADPADCYAGVTALTEALADLTAAKV